MPNSPIEEMQSNQLRLNDLSLLISLLKEIKENFADLNILYLEHSKIISVLLKISRVFEVLTRNDKNKQLIRNKFGKYDWSNSKKYNRYGIDFDFLARFKLVLDQTSIVKEKTNILLTDISKSLKDEVITLYDKLLIIAQQEIVDLEKSSNIEQLKASSDNKSLAKIKAEMTGFSKIQNDAFQTREIEYLTNIAEVAYVELLFSQAISDIDNLLLTTEENCLTRESRYAFGRMLSILGETYKNIPDYFRASQLQAIFEIVSGLRDKIAHGHKKYVYDPPPELTSKLTVAIIQNYLAATKDALISLLANTQSVKTYEDIKRLSQLKFSSEEVAYFTKLENQTTQLEEIYYRTGAEAQILIAQSNIAIATQPVETPPIDALTTVSKKKYSPAETLARKITGIIQHRQSLQATLAILERDHDDKERNTLIEKKYKDKDGKIKNIDKVIEGLIKDIDKDMVKEEQEKKAYLDSTQSEFDEQLLKKTQLDMQNTRTIQVKKEKQKKTRALLKSMQKENQYLMTLFKKDPLNIYAIEYAVTVIGEIGRELVDQNDDRLTSMTPQDFIVSLRTTINTRNKKMHELINALKIPLHEIILRETLPMHPEVKALKKIITIQETDVPLDIGTLFTLSFAYIELKQFNKAIEAFNNILTICQKSYTKPNIILNVYIGLATAYGLQGDEQLKKQNIIEANEYFRLKCNCLTHVLALHQVIAFGLEPPYVFEIKKLFDPHTDCTHIDEADLPVDIITAGILNNCGITFGKLQQHEKQVAYLTKAVQIAHQLGDVEREAKYLSNLSNYYIERACSQNENFLVQSVFMTIPTNQMLNCAIGCLWQTHRLLTSLENTLQVFYVNNLLKLCRALQLTELPFFFILAKQYLEITKKILDTLPGRKNEYEFVEFSRLEKINTNRIQRTIDTLSQYLPEGRCVEEELTQRFGTEDEQNIFLLQTAIQGLGSVYGTIGLPHDLTEELNQIKTAHQKMPTTTVEDKVVRDIHVLQDEGVLAFNNKQYQIAIDKFLGALSLCENEALSCEVRIHFRKRAYTDLARSYRENKDAENATKYFLYHIALIGNEVDLDTDGIECLNEVYKLDKRSPEILAPIFEKLDLQYQIMEKSLDKYDDFLTCLAGVFLRTRQFDKALTAIARAINILRSRNLPHNHEKKICALISLSRIQTEYYEHVTCLKSVLSQEQYEFYKKIAIILEKTSSWDELTQKLLQNPLENANQMIDIIPKILRGEETGHFVSANSSCIPFSIPQTNYQNVAPQKAVPKYYIPNFTSHKKALLADKPCNIIEDSQSNSAWIEIEPHYLKKEFREQLSLFRVKISNIDDALKKAIKTSLPFATIEEEDNAIIITGEQMTKPELERLVTDWNDEKKNLSSYAGLKSGFLR